MAVQEITLTIDCKEVVIWRTLAAGCTNRGSHVPVEILGVVSEYGFVLLFEERA